MSYQDRSGWIPTSAESVVLLLLTATVYAAFFLKEIGYARYFGVPVDIISEKEIGLVLTAEAILFSALSYVSKVNLVWIFAPRGEGVLSSFVRRWIASVLLLGFAMYPYLTSGLSIWWFVILVGFLAFSAFVWPIITQRRITGYERKLTAQGEVEREGGGIVESILKPIGHEGTATIGVIVAILFFAYGLGRKEAIEQETFYAVDETPGWVVIKIYGDLVVLAEVDGCARTLGGVLKITRVAGGGPLYLRKVTIGPLAPAPSTIMNRAIAFDTP